MRKARYGQVFSGLLRSARKVPAPLLVVAFVLGIGVSAMVSNSLLPGKSAQQASGRSLETGVSQGTNTLALKIDDDLSGFSARLRANSRDR